MPPTKGLTTLSSVPEADLIDQPILGENQSFESAMGDFIEERRTSIPELPCCADPKGKKDVIADFNNNAPSLLAISTFLDKLLPRMDKTILRVSKVQFEALSRVRGIMGEDFVKDFAERCDSMAPSMEVLRDKLVKFRHQYLLSPELGASADIHALLTEVQTVFYKEWNDMVIGEEFNSVIKRHVLPSTRGTAEDDKAVSEEELAVWGLTHAVSADLTRKRTMEILDKASKNVSPEELMALLGNKTRMAVSHLTNVSNNVLCAGMPDDTRGLYFDEGINRVEGATLLSRDITSTLSKYRELDQQLGFHLVDGAYEITDAEEVKTA